MKKTLFAAAALSLLAVLPANAADLEIRSIMKEIGERTEAVVRGINTGDFKSVEKAAATLADHRKPSMGERMRIMALLKTDMGDFKSFDDKVHEASAGLARAASKGDAAETISKFTEVLKSCNGCHEKYRARIIDHFYGEKK